MPRLQTTVQTQWEQTSVDSHSFYCSAKHLTKWWPRQKCTTTMCHSCLGSWWQHSQLLQEVSSIQPGAELLSPSVIQKTVSFWTGSAFFFWFTSLLHWTSVPPSLLPHLHLPHFFPFLQTPCQYIVASVGFTTPPTLTVPIERGSVKLNLSRTGHLEQEVRVICYTENWTASRSVIFVERPNSLTSAVVFPPNETQCTCNVVLLDGEQDQPKVAFYVRLATLSPNALVAQDTVIVFITPDISRCEPLKTNTNVIMLINIPLDIIGTILLCLMINVQCRGLISPGGERKA